MNQIQTGFYWNSEENQIIFHVPNPDKINWEVLDIPDEITLKRHASITFAARTGNESSLKSLSILLGRKRADDYVSIPDREWSLYKKN